MALFGKKIKDGAPAVGADAGIDDGGVMIAEAPRPTKAARVPKAAKGKVVKNGTVVGLNIGNQFIKAVEVTSKGGELSVTAMGAVPTPAESYSNGNVLSVSALSGAIRDLWRGAGIKSKVAITSVAGTGALVVRVIEVPRMSDGELGDNMKVDADRYIPFPPSEVVMDFKALRELPTDPDAPNMEVLLAAAQREIIDLHVQVVQKAKLDPRAIDVEPIAAARAMQLERQSGALIDYNEITAIVNLGATGTEISILRGDILVFTRVVPGGGNLITQAIAQGLGLTLADAERMKIESADAQAPAGYQTGNDFGLGGADEFNFGGEEFGGGNDLNSAFDDISANPTAAASDDPFDLDFFNQGPKDEPGAGHAQKQGEPGEETPAFNFSGFDFDEPTTPQAPATGSAEAQPVASDSPAPLAFNFGFDDEDNSPVVTSSETQIASSTPTEKHTAPLEDFSTPDVTSQSAVAQSTTPVSNSGILGGDFSMPSAFDFDNFDLPATTPESSSTISTPVESMPQPGSTPPSPFAFSATPAPTSSLGDTTPASLDLDDNDLASKTTPNQAIPEAAAPVQSPFDFTVSEPPAVVALPPVVAEAEVASASIPAAVEASAPTAADDFDLDAIFGSSAPVTTPSAAPSTSPTINLEKTPSAQPATSDEFETSNPVPVATPAAMGSEGLDLSGTDTRNDFMAGFGATDDFAPFEATRPSGGSGADADALYGLIYPSLEELAGEVRRSLEFHLGRYPDATISRLVLLGGGARLRNLDVFLTQMLGVPTTVSNPFAHIAVQTPKLAPGYANENGPLCAVALGLALRDFVD